MILDRLKRSFGEPDARSASGRALIEERYRSLRRQVPIVYLLGLVNLSAMEIAATGRLSLGLNLPSFIAFCGLIRLWHWFGKGSGADTDHRLMTRRMRQTVWFAGAVCLAVSARCLYLLQVGDASSHMAVMLFGGLTAIGVAYGLTALPAAARIPLLLIIGPLSVDALISNDPKFAGAAFGLVVVAVLTMRLLSAHSRHFTNVIHSRSNIARERERVQHAHREAVIAATTDFLTGLPNRRAFVAALDAMTSETRDCFAVAILDLDRFKTVNDTFGHVAGDQLLEEVAARLVEAVPPGGLVARLGGDEFGLLVPDVRHGPDAKRIGDQILRRVNGPVLLDGREFAVSASCGLGISHRREAPSPSRLMADADLALYEAKENPGAGAAVFELRMEAPRRRRAQIEQAVRLPGFRDQLSIVFQPIFNLSTGRIIANEALARWRNEELGSVGPSEFVPIAEQLNLIDGINLHLMKLAFDAARDWPGHIKLSFNLSAVQLCSTGSAEVVLGALKAARLTARSLQVEVTETALLRDFERARENLNILRDAGATIVLDDFGAGYASISYLRELCFDQIKLDGALVTAAQQSADGKQLLRAVIVLCEVLGVSSVAEHVGSAELLKLVLELGCTAGQGFWLEPPLSAAELRKRLSSELPANEAPRRAA
jgi:diguanylate cyclase (GGDEF)-like protein